MRNWTARGLIVVFAWLPLAWSAYANDLPAGGKAKSDDALHSLADTIEQSLTQLRVGGTHSFHDEGYAQQWRGKVDKFRMDLAKFPPKGAPSVETVHEMLLQLETLVSYGITEAAKRSADLQMIHVMLADLRHRLADNRPPEPLQAPFDELTASNWMVRVNMSKQIAVAARIELDKMEPLIAATHHDAMMHEHHQHHTDELFNLRNTVATYLRNAEMALETTYSQLNDGYARQERDLTELRAIVYGRLEDHSEYYIADDHGYPLFRELDRQLAIAESFVAYQRVFGKTPSVSSLERIAEFRHLRRQYAQARRQRLGDRPLQVSQDRLDDRRAIAERVLSLANDSFANHGPIAFKSAIQAVRLPRDGSTEAMQLVAAPVDKNGPVESAHGQSDVVHEFELVTPVRGDDNEWRLWWITIRSEAGLASPAASANWHVAEATECGPIDEATWIRPR